MPPSVRTASTGRLPRMADLLTHDAATRQARNPQLWKMACDARDRVLADLARTLTDPAPPFRQCWLVADHEGRLAGVAHSILLPVPPIYAGAFGPPGLLMPDCHVASDAPAGTRQALLDAAEADLRAAGARLLLASAPTGSAWCATFARNGYAPLTLYYAGTGLAPGKRPDTVRPASERDLTRIVALSARNRRVLSALDPFWEPHPQADQRFGDWMARSLTLTDRKMLVSARAGTVQGYAIAQPASHLHFPAAHDIDAVGFIDDYFHTDHDDDAAPCDDAAASGLLKAAEAWLAGRGMTSVLIVCPAAWRSKRALLEATGHHLAASWYLKRT